MKLSPPFFFIYFFPNVCIASCNHTALGPLCCFISLPAKWCVCCWHSHLAVVLSLFFSPSLQAKNNTGWVWVSNNPTPKQKQLAQLFLPLPACIAMLVDLVTLGGRGGGKGGQNANQKINSLTLPFPFSLSSPQKSSPTFPELGTSPKGHSPTSKLPELEHPKFDTQ